MYIAIENDKALSILQQLLEMPSVSQGSHLRHLCSVRVESRPKGIINIKQIHLVPPVPSCEEPEALPVSNCQEDAFALHDPNANSRRRPKKSALQHQDSHADAKNAVKPSPNLGVLPPAWRDSIPIAMPIRRLMYLAPDARTVIATWAHLCRAPAVAIQVHQIRHVGEPHRQIIKMLLLMMTIILSALGWGPRKVKHLEVGRVQDDIHVAGLLGW